MMNPNESSDIWTHCVALYAEHNDATSFDSFELERIPKEIRTFIEHKNIKTNFFRKQEYNSIMRGYFCIVSLIWMTLTKFTFTNLFWPNNLKKKMII